MFIPAGATAKWSAPALIGMGGAILALDGTDLILPIFGLVQAVALAWFGYRQHRGDQSTAEQSIRVDRSDRLMDQLQEQLDKTTLRLEVQAGVIVELRERINSLTVQLAERDVRITQLTAENTLLLAQVAPK